MILKPQDVMVVLKLIAMGERRWSYAQLAGELFMSASEVHAAVKRGLKSRLLIQRGADVQPEPNTKAVEEFLIHGLKFAFPADHGPIARGMKTSYAADIFDGILMNDQQHPPVWPDAEGMDRGPSLSPLYKTAPKAAAADAELYALLVLVDAIRDGRARERIIAEKMLRQRLSYEA